MERPVQKSKHRTVVLLIFMLKMKKAPPDYNLRNSKKIFIICLVRSPQG